MNNGLKNAVIFDNINTPSYAILPILQYIKNYKNKHICLPFDTKKSNYYKILKNKGFNYVYPYHLDNEKDFFKENFNDFDLLISNPPFSLKDKILEKLFEIDKPFIMLLPLTTLSSIKRVNLFIKNPIDIIIFDKRIDYIIRNKQTKSNWFSSCYITYKVLNKRIIFKKLNKEEK